MKKEIAFGKRKTSFVELLFVLYCLSAYFLPLMQRLRTHITKHFMIPLVILGLSLYVVRPAYAQANQSFSFWLSSLVDDTQMPELQKEVDLLNLQAPGTNIYELMLQVSELLSKSDLEGTPSDSRQAPQKIYHVLLQQWNHFQSGKGMAATPPVEVLKPLLSPQVDKLQSGTDLRMHTSIQGYDDPEATVHLPKGTGFYTNLSPMVTGIAIGAP